MGVQWWTLPPRFPYELVPDGAALGPHHAYIGLLLAALAVWVVGDNLRRDEPVVSAVSVVVLEFGFAATWKYHHVTGALLSLAGALSLLVTPLVPGGEWEPYPRRWRVVCAVGGLVALDDVVEHALGWVTPLDLVWTSAIYPALP